MDSMLVSITVNSACYKTFLEDLKKVNNLRVSVSFTAEDIIKTIIEIAIL